MFGGDKPLLKATNTATLKASSAIVRATEPWSASFSIRSNHSNTVVFNTHVKGRWSDLSRQPGFRKVRYCRIVRPIFGSALVIFRGVVQYGVMDSKSRDRSQEARTSEQRDSTRQMLTCDHPARGRQPDPSLSPRCPGHVPDRAGLGLR